MITIALITIVAYCPVLFNFFLGDDFVHLQWLQRAVIDPTLIVRNFYSSWLDVITTKFYRPLISLFMVGDYIVWRTNGLGFHITNLLFHLVNTMFVFLICLSLQQMNQSQLHGRFRNCSWPALAAILFGLYPLHPETVSWITGRVDAIVTTFCLATLWFFIEWRKSKRNKLLAFAMLAMVAALLSKEMAITLPAIVFAFVYCWRSCDGAISSKPVAPKGARKLRPDALAAVKRAFVSSLPFWITLALYFGLRRFALGTFIGGYDDSLLNIGNWHNLLYAWLHSLKIMLVPLNKEVVSSRGIIALAWEFCTIFGVIATIVFCLSGSNGKTIRFLVAWLALSLLPVYKVFYIGDDLQGSRFAYLATAPLCCLLTFGISQLYSLRHDDNFYRPLNPFFTGSFRQKFFAKTAIIVAFIWTALAFYLLWQNNLVWRQAGQESKRITGELREIYSQTENDPQTLLVGLPDNVQGAYLSRNAFPGILQKPQFFKNINNCLPLNDSETVLPFGFLKNSLREAVGGGKSFVYLWNDGQQKLLPYVPPQTDRIASAHLWHGSSLLAALTPCGTTRKVACKQNDAKQDDGFAVALIEDSGRGLAWDFLPGNLSCFDTDFIAIVFSGTPPKLVMSYTNSIPGDESKHPSATISGQTDPNRSNSLIFSLHSRPSWAFGGMINRLHFRAPGCINCQIRSIEIMPASKFMPSLTCRNAGFLGSKGFFHLNRNRQTVILDLSVDQIPDAASVKIEITKANCFFSPAQQNSVSDDGPIMKTIPYNKRYGRITLPGKIFPAHGLYELRIRAVNPNGQNLGVAGDHIVIAVDE